MGIKSAILLAGIIASADAVESDVRQQPSKHSRFLRKRQKGRLLNKNKQVVDSSTTKVIEKRHTKKNKKNDIDITEEDVGFWTRTLQQSFPPTPQPNPIPPPTTPSPIEITPSPTPGGPIETPNPTELPPVVSTPAPTPLGLEPTPSPTTDEPTVSPSGAPTFPCNLTPDERAAQIQTLMETVSDPATFADPESPQSQALNWITNEDTITPIMCPNQENIGCSRGGSINPMIQRYVLAVFYFATEGGDWDQCSAPNDLDSVISITAANAQCDRVVTPFGVANDRVGDTSTDAWLGPVNECEWGGVACWGMDTPNLNMCVDQIDFENDGLAGELATEVSQLTSMRFLILEQGAISGSIPDSYGDLERLLILDMDFNQLTGTLPETLFDLNSLQQLDLNDNQITGGISPRIGDLSLLTFFQIDHNLLSGEIPSEMGELNNLRIAFLSANDLVGTMPEEVCALRNNTSPPGVLGVLVTDCAGADPEVVCPCCSSCA